MQSTTSRRKALLEILEHQNVTNQQQLQQLLLLRGIEATQATLSRDLKALRVVKSAGEGYRLPMQTLTPSLEPHGIASIEFSGQNGVIKTQPGYAPAVAARIDHLHCPSIMGTLAGDDTILLILRLGSSPEEVLANLATIIPNISDCRI